MNTKEEIDNDYKLIPMSEITDEARIIAVRWMECDDKNWIENKHKLASDIMNYARRYKAQSQPKPVEQPESKEDELWFIANKKAEEEGNFPYSDFQGKEKGVDDEHTGQALRGAYSGGYVDGYKDALQAPVEPVEEEEKDFKIENYEFIKYPETKAVDQKDTRIPHRVERLSDNICFEKGEKVMSTWGEQVITGFDIVGNHMVVDFETCRNPLSKVSKLNPKETVEGEVLEPIYKLVKASDKPSTHYENVFCQFKGSKLIAYYDNSIKQYRAGTRTYQLSEIEWLKQIKPQQ